jgi:hypothetical protein
VRAPALENHSFLFAMNPFLYNDVTKGFLVFCQASNRCYGIEWVPAALRIRVFDANQWASRDSIECHQFKLLKTDASCVANSMLPHQIIRCSTEETTLLVAPVLTLVVNHTDFPDKADRHVYATLQYDKHTQVTFCINREFFRAAECSGILAKPVGWH